MTPLVLSGCGRLGQRIAALALDATDIKLVGVLVRADSPLQGQDVGSLWGRTTGIICTSNESILAEGVLVETAPRRPALAHVHKSAALGQAALVATTGFEAAERTQLLAHGGQIPLLLAPNLSLGIAVLQDLVARAAAALPSYQVEILELHHAKKRDAPSGTAWALGATIAEARGQDIRRDAILARAGDIGPRGQSEVGMQSIRGGDIVGEHTIYLIGPTERLELTHRAASRDVFAAGALVAARYLHGRAPGVYSMKDVLIP